MKDSITEKQRNYLMVAIKYSDIELPDRFEDVGGVKVNYRDQRFVDWLDENMSKAQASAWITRLDEAKQNEGLEEFQRFINENYAKQ